MTSERFLQIRNSEFMIVDPILQKRKLGLKERHTTNVWQSRTWKPGLLTLSSLVFPPHHAVQLRSLSKQGPNQTPSLCRNFWLLFLTYMGSNTTYLPSKPFPLFLFFSYQFPTAPLHLPISSANLIYHWVLSVLPPYYGSTWNGYPLLPTLCILIIFQSTTRAPPPLTLGLETSLKPHWSLYLHPSLHVLLLIWHWCVLVFLPLSCKFMNC